MVMISFDTYFEIFVTLQRRIVSFIQTLLDFFASNAKKDKQLWKNPKRLEFLIFLWFFL